MATRQATVEHIVGQIGTPGTVVARKMFGEYGLYAGGKLVALVCDDTLFVKPTPGGRSLVAGLGEASPYPGAKPCLVVPGERLDEGDWLTELIRITAAQLPLPAPKRKRAAKEGARPGRE